MYILRKYRRTLVMISVFAVLGMCVILVVQYINVQGFKKTLVTLVDTGTKGAYSLSIEKTEIDHLHTRFSLHQVRIVRNDTASSPGIEEVLIPVLSVDVGTLISMISSRQFKINEFVIAEPMVKIMRKAADNQVRVERVNAAKQIAQFWPAVKAILSQFDIKLFRIERAGLDLLSTEETDLNIRLLDLLISNWNMRDLNEDAQLKLSLGNQVLNMSNSVFTFGAVAYEYKTNELSILDYTFTQRDSLEQIQMELDGDSLKLINLDYEHLVNDQAYVLDQLLIVKPSLRANLYPSKSRTTKSWHPLSDLLKKNLGSLRIREGHIQDALVVLNVFSKTDTMELNLPRMDLYASMFEVNEDSSTLMLGDLVMDVYETELDLNEMMSIEFSKLSYDENYNVTIDSLKVVDNAVQDDMFICELVELRNFSIFNYFYENDFRIDSLVLRNGHINLQRDPAGIKNANMGGAGSEDKLRPEVHIGNLQLENIQADVSLDQRSIRLTDVSGTINNLVKEDRITYSFRNFRSANISYREPQKELELRLDRTSVEPGSLAINSIEASFKTLGLTLDDFRAVPVGDLMNISSGNQWKSIEFGTAKLVGKLPRGESEAGPQNSANTDQSVGHIRFDELVTNLTLSDTSAISAKITDFYLEDGNLVKGKPGYSKVKADLHEIVYKNGGSTLKLEQTEINSDSLSALKDLQFVNHTGSVLTVAQIDLGPWELRSGEYDIDHITLADLHYQDPLSEQVSRADSVKLVGLRVPSDTTPYVGQLLVYAPDINLKLPSKKRQPDTDKKSPLSSPLKMFGKIQLSPGQVMLDDQQFTFEQIELDMEREQLEVDMKLLAFKTPSNSIHVGRIWSREAEIYLDSVYVVPVPEFLESVETETDVLAAQLNRIKFFNLHLDRLKETGDVWLDGMEVDGFDISIRRDKTLPDPDPETKPYLLSELISLPPQVNLPWISIKNGRLVYFEIGEDTGQEGHIALNDIMIMMNRQSSSGRPEQMLSGSATVYQQGDLSFGYDQLDSGKFFLEVRLTDLPMGSLNQMVDPLQAARIRSGHLHDFQYTMTGDSLQAEGQSSITYDDLEVEIFKKNQPEVRNLGSELLTLLLNKVILKHSRTDATADFVQERITYKGPINYWVKSGIHGASAAVLKGKQPKKRKRDKDKNALVKDNKD